jgi:hypothetical protein
MPLPTLPRCLSEPCRLEHPMLLPVPLAARELRPEILELSAVVVLLERARRERVGNVLHRLAVRVAYRTPGSVRLRRV